MANAVEEYYPLMEHFYTIQGEGFNSGKSAYFLRLGGCDVGCVWCDVKESWPADTHPKASSTEMLNLVLQSGAKNVVITGGEPLMYNLDNLCKLLINNSLNVFLETSGAHPFSGKFDWICLSPKKFKKPLDEWYEKANELKIIVYNQSDFRWAEEHAKKVKGHCKLYLQPEWSKEKHMLPLIIEFVKKNPRWTLSLQTHKYMNIP